MPEKTERPIILCAGQNGRCLVYGYVEKDPEPGQPVKLRRARMVVYYTSGGTFGLAADGPPDGSRVTHAGTDKKQANETRALALALQGEG